MDSKKELLNTELSRLKTLVPVKNSAIITTDGLLVVSDMEDELQSERIAAMGATIFGASETTVNEIHKDIVDYILIKSEKSEILLFKIGESTILAAILESKIRNDKIIDNIKDFTLALKNIIYNE